MRTKSPAQSETPLIAVAGAGGFIGRRLVQRLAAEDVSVRALMRQPATPIANEVVVQFDLADPAVIDGAALQGSQVVYYLVHAMAEGPDFAALDRQYARRFAAAAQRAHVGKVIYLGGLYPRGAAHLSPQLQSRREVGEILMGECGAMVVRAGIIIGRGSAAFDIMRSLVMHLPIMITPRWVSSRCQPIDAGDAIEALTRARMLPAGREVDLAGPDVVSYSAMMQAAADELGLRRLIIPVPIFSPSLSSHWLRFITDVPLPVARALVESLHQDAIADGPDLCAEAGIKPIGFPTALKRALTARGPDGGN
ncbi:MAG TPA: NAD(P)H-binding protein [Candidatus Binataceae bacterium]|nr:NAD(P)H-binding protein [Candidatus Binataceae bacterium]